MASGSGTTRSLFSLIGGRATTAERRSMAGGATQSVRDYYRELRQMGASKAEARALARSYASNTRVT